MADRPDEGVAAFRGVTLVEVLMSLLIMSIGVSAVAALFPISVLRSIQATQLTNAAILKTNVETVLQMRPELVFDPDGDGNIAEHVGRTEELHYIIDPAGYFQMATGATFSIPAFSVFPTLSTGNNPAIPNDSTLRGGADWFGNLDTNTDGVPEPFAFLPRYDGGTRTGTISGIFPNGFQPAGGDPEEARALRLLGSTLTKLGDAWDTQFDGIPVEFVFADGSTGTTAGVTAAIVGVRFDADVDLDAVPTARSMIPQIAGSQLISDPGICRAVVFSADGNFSAALPLIAVNPGSTPIIPSCTWSEDIDFSGTLNGTEDINLNGTLDVRTLPAQFINPATNQYEIGRVLLQSSRTHDYNWLLTVRRGRDGQARGVDVVITHNKGITPDDERLYTAGLVQGASIINVFQDGGLSTGDIAEPAIRKSGYLLDVENARWYRIRDYREGTLLPIGSLPPADGFVITLETPVISSSIGGQVMFLPGVIDVYPMGSIAAPDNL
ncbi:MAG: prepilin-type N-terminal cleavage/methylation domain-containing protein [Planctomycetaceae bacterium]